MGGWRKIFFRLRFLSLGDDARCVHVHTPARPGSKCNVLVKRMVNVVSLSSDSLSVAKEKNRDECGAPLIHGR